MRETLQRAWNWLKPESGGIAIITGCVLFASVLAYKTYAQAHPAPAVSASMVPLMPNVDSKRMEIIAMDIDDGVQFGLPYFEEVTLNTPIVQNWNGKWPGLVLSITCFSPTSPVRPNECFVSADCNHNTLGRLLALNPGMTMAITQGTVGQGASARAVTAVVIDAPRTP